MLRSLLATYRAAFAGLGRSVWLLSIASLINRAGTMVMPFLLLFLIERRGFTKVEAGRTLALYGLAAMFASYAGGRLCDRFGAVRILKASLLLTGFAFLALGRVEGRLAIYGMVILLSLVGEVFRAANMTALTAASAPGERSRSIALLRLAINAGMAVGPSAGGLLAAYGYEWLFVVDGATSILAAGLLEIAFPGGAPARMAGAARAAGAEAVPAAVGVAPGLASPETPPREAPPRRSAFRDRPLLAILGLVFLLNTVTFQIASTFPLSLRDLYGFSKAWIGLALGVNTLIIILFEMVLVHSLRDRDPLKVAAVGAVLFCGGLALLPFGHGFAYLASTIVIWTLGEMLVFPLVTSAVAARAPEESAGAYMGLLSFAFAAAFVVAPLVGTWAYEQLGPRTLWLGCGAVGLLVGAGFQWVARATARPAAVPARPAAVPAGPSGAPP